VSDRRNRFGKGLSDLPGRLYRKRTTVTDDRTFLRWIIASLVVIASGFIFFFGSALLVNSLGLEFTYVSVRTFETVHLVILGEPLDYQVLLLALVLSSLGCILPLLVRRRRVPDAMILTHLVLPVISILLSQRLEERLWEAVSALPFSSYVLTQRGWDLKSTLLSFAAILMVFVTLKYFRYMFEFPRLLASLSVLTVSFSAYIIVGSMSLVTLIEGPKRFALLFDQPSASQPTDIFWKMAQLDLNAFSTFYQAAPYLLIVIFASWIWLPAVFVLWKRLRRSRSGSRLDLHGQIAEQSRSDREPTLRRKVIAWAPMVLVAASIITGGYVVYLPYFHQNELVGFDAPWYAQTLVALNRPQEFWGIVLTEPRAPYLLIQYFIMHLLGVTSEMAVKLAPIPIVALVALASYVLVKSLLNDGYLGALAAVLSAFSVQTTAGLTGSIFAEWLAFAWIMIFYAILFRSVDTGSRKLLLAAVLVSWLVLFTHAWTWGAFMIVLMVNLILTAAASRSGLLGRDRAGVLRRCSLWLLMVIAMNTALVAVILLVASPFGASRSTIPAGYALLTSLLNVNRLAGLDFSADSLAYVMRSYLGGVYFNAIIFALAVVGILAIREVAPEGRYALISWILVTSILTVIADYWLQWRTLYLLPYYILAVLGIYSLKLALQRSMPKGVDKRSRIVLSAFMGSLCLALVVLQLNYTLRCIGQLTVYF
jgi:hypothetical protein